MTYAALEGTLPEIGIEQLKAAIAVGVYAAECAKTLVDAQNAILRPEGELEQKFVKWIEEHDGAKKRHNGSWSLPSYGQAWLARD